MAKTIKDEIKKYLNTNSKTKTAIKHARAKKEIMKCLPLNIIKGVKNIEVKNSSIIIVATNPSWRQEINFFKKEIMKKIHKKYRNYKDIKITIL